MRTDSGEVYWDKGWQLFEDSGRMLRKLRLYNLNTPECVPTEMFINQLFTTSTAHSERPMTLSVTLPMRSFETPVLP